MSLSLVQSLPLFTILNDRVVYQQVVCPPCVPDYQKYMREVDVGDQMLSGREKEFEVVETWLLVPSRCCIAEQLYRLYT